MSTVSSPLRLRCLEYGAGFERTGIASRAGAVVAVSQGVLVVSIWLLSRCYSGIVHDSRIYIGRALANLDPAGVGREAMFSLDGQTRFTIYIGLIQPLVHVLGASRAAMLATLAALVLWLAAAAWLATRLVPRALVPFALICAAVLPAGYGPFGVFSYGEAFATPRALAEACVLAAIAALIDRRLALCAVLLVAGALLHPIMALAGCGVVFVALALDEPRWWALAVVGAVGLAGGVLGRLGPLGSLFTPFDPAWLAIVKVRTPFLFESAWPLAAWSQAAVAGATVLIAAILSGGRARNVLLAAVLVAACGLACAFLLAERTSSVLLLQLQLWRMLWLVQGLAALTLPFCAWRLFAGRRPERFALALLVCGWGMTASPVLAFPCCLAAVGVLALGRRSSNNVSPTLVWAALCAVGLIVFGWCIDVLALWEGIKAAARAGAPVRLTDVLASGILQNVVACSVVALSLRSRPSPPTRLQAAAMGGLAAVTALLALAAWDQRTPTQAMMDRGEGRAALARLVGSGQGGVLWLGDNVAPLFWIGQPTWINRFQGTAGVFSRRLSLQWDGRSKALIASGLGDITDRSPWAAATGEALSPAATGDAIARLCRVSDGPKAVVAPGDLTPLFGAGEASLWRAPREDFSSRFSKGELRFTRLDRYTVVRCKDGLGTWRSPT